jgi:glycosyltransferase involved in cell wall biosynthesis
MKPPVVFVILQTGSLANGGVQSITEIMSRLNDHRAIILTNSESRFSRTWRSRGMDVHICPEEASPGLKRNPVGAFRSYWRYHRALTGILRKSGANVIHANDPLAFQMSLAAVKSSRRVRLALSLRGTLDPDRRPPTFKYRLIFAAADHVFYLSEEMAGRWRQVASNATRSSSVTYSIADPQRFKPSPVPDGDPAIVLVSGILSHGKGQLEFIRHVVPKLAAAGVDSWFAGDSDFETDPYAAACVEAAAPFKASVRFLGFRDDIPELMRQASVVAVPSRHEGLMRAMVEAMSCGRPVVSFDVCSAREVLEDKSGGAGIVVRQGDYAAMAHAILRYTSDRQALAAAGQAGSTAARQLFDADAVVERYERIYRELGKS